MIYLDTSVVVPLFLSDIHSVKVLAWMERGGEPRTLSPWTVAEFSSAAARLVRIGQITNEARSRAEASLDGWLSQVGVTAVSATDFIQARVLIRSDRANLRTPDALHLAIAQRLRASIATVDRAMFEAALAHGIAAEIL